ncbi:RidA family protein [Cupriavidus alkaliphilus]|uniref:RidA family protein n=1 Tax=Cupriavidus alkaliphilus TaxID=942866 RepID=UPI0017DF46AF|nr:RidA family protein [Cupriavidus alkaliphilus]MBB3012573.1 enamine deaminase RidA (YjgF/YER057c/UK114 family) [Cupriavidus alkaliphilus]
MNRKISSGSIFESAVGFSRAIVDGRYVHVAGTTGFDYAVMRISDSLIEQCHQCFRNIADALAQAGCSLDDVVRVRYYLADVGFFEELTPMLSQLFWSARPATTAIVCQLVDPRMKVEIEVTALLREPVQA